MFSRIIVSCSICLLCSFGAVAQTYEEGRIRARNLYELMGKIDKKFMSRNEVYWRSIRRSPYSRARVKIKAIRNVWIRPVADSIFKSDTIYVLAATSDVSPFVPDYEWVWGGGYSYRLNPWGPVKIFIDECSARDEPLNASILNKKLFYLDLNEFRGEPYMHYEIIRDGNNVFRYRYQYLFVPILPRFDDAWDDTIVPSTGSIHRWEKLQQYYLEHPDEWEKARERFLRPF